MLQGLYSLWDTNTDVWKGPKKNIIYNYRGADLRLGVILG